MLHAIEKSKTRISTRYLGDRDGIELRVSEEDEITSTILGPLDFLSAAENHRFWQRLLASVKHPNFLPSSQPSNVEFGFWERRIANDNSRPIEPDAVVRMYWPDGSTRILLIELKWHAPLSGKDQLHRQWLQYLTEMERQTALHLFIAPNVSAGESARSNKDVWGDRKLVLLSWLHIRSVLSEFSTETAAIGRWARVADQFLESVHIRKFRGFNYLFNEQVQLPEGLPSSLFWHA
jgi:hypothetical protein